MTEKQQAILVTGFGVADDTARKKSFDAIVQDFRIAFPHCEIYEAYTSEFLRRVLVKRGIYKDNLPDALKRLTEHNFSHVLIQPLHFTPGEEFDKKIRMVTASAKFDFANLLLGEPLFFCEDDYIKTLHVVCAVVPLQPEEQMVLLGHGSPHQHNVVYEHLQAICDKQRLPIHIGVIEETDTPNFQQVAARLKTMEAEKIVLAPLLFSGGTHVVRDMAGDIPTSWKSRFLCMGLSVRTVLTGLGEYAAFRKLYIEKARRTLVNLEP